MSKNSSNPKEDVLRYVGKTIHFSTDDVASQFGFSRRQAGAYLAQLVRAGVVEYDNPATRDDVSQWVFVGGGTPANTNETEAKPRRVGRPRKTASPSAPLSQDEHEFVRIALALGLDRVNVLLEDVKARVDALFVA